MIPNKPMPQASLIIVTYNNLDYTRQCLQSIYAKTLEPTFEVVVVDNASQDGTVEFLKELAATQPNIQLIFNQTNAGFAKANNQGAQAAQGEYLVFLNNDTVVTPGWLNGLIRHLQQPQAGIVGPVTNSSGNESRIEVDYQDPSGIDDFAERYTRTHAGQAFEIEMLAFFCVAMRRTTFEQVGPLDERFGLGLFEDDDYAVRVKQMGYKIVCVEDIFVHHWGNASIGRLGYQTYWKLFTENRQKFEEKWNTKWIPPHYRSELMPKQVSELIESTIQLQIYIQQLETTLQQLQTTLDSIYHSRAWQIVDKYWTFKAWLKQQMKNLAPSRNIED